MTEQVVGKHVVVGHLVESRHAALIEMTNTLSGKLRNHFILKIAEACLDKYPLRMSDYASTREEVGKGTPVKITIREDLYPRMYTRYKDLPHGIRSVVLMNLLNRYAELMAGAPEMVEDAVRELDAAGLEEGVRKASERPAETMVAHETQSPVPQVDMPPAAEDVSSDVASPASEVGMNIQPEEDPLIGFNSGL